MMIRATPLLLMLIWAPFVANAQEPATLAQCAQVQPVVQRLLEDAASRLEAARQTNSATALRTAVDDLDAALRDVRAQLTPCASVQPGADAHAGHTMPNVQPAPTAAPGTPVMAPGSTSPAPAAVVPGAKPPAGAIDPHAGHVMPRVPVKPAPTGKPASAAKPPSGTQPPTATPAVDHSKMEMGTPAKPAPAAKPATGAKPPAPAAPVDHSKMDMDTSAKPAPTKGGQAAAQATDPVCGLKVDPETAPSTKHQGQTYYFCSDQHQQLFQKNPVKFVPKQR